LLIVRTINFIAATITKKILVKKLIVVTTIKYFVVFLLIIVTVNTFSIFLEVAIFMREGTNVDQVEAKTFGQYGYSY
jgi:hypothetical protein